MMTQDATLITDAYALAALKHRTQTDLNGAPYIYHLINVAMRVRALGAEYEITAILHDSVEDTDLTLSEIEQKFGSAVKDAVAAMTHQKSEDYFEDYLPRIMENKIALHVKYADSSDNYSKLEKLADPKTKARLKEKYEKVLSRLKPFIA